MPLSVDEVKNYCRAMLGYPKVEVELDDSHFQIAMDKTLRTISLHRPKLKYVSFSVSSGTQFYDLSDEDIGYGVIDVQYAPAEYLMNQEFDVFNPRVINSDLGLADYELGMIYAESARKVVSADFEWDFNIDTGMVMLSPIPARSYTAVAVCLDEIVGSEIRNPWLKQWALDFSLAVTKQMLGEVRRKIRAIEGTENTFELDGAELIQEGIEKENQMLEEIKEKSGDFVPPMMGN